MGLRKSPHSGRMKRLPKRNRTAVRPYSVPIFNTGTGALVRQPEFIVPNRTYTTVQSFQALANCVSSSSAPTFTAGYVALNAMDQYTSWQAVFDQYRIELIEYTFMPTSSEGFSASNVGMFTVVVDLDDNTALTTVASAMDYPQQQTVRGSDPVRVVWKPHIALAGYSGAFSSYINEGPQWIDCSSPAVQHYGVKTAWTQTGSAYTYNIAIRCRVSFRNVR